MLLDSSSSEGREEEKSEGWSSLQRGTPHEIDPTTRLVAELAMACFPHIESQPDSFHCSYGYILSGKREWAHTHHRRRA